VTLDTTVAEEAAASARVCIPGACRDPWIREPPARHHRLCETLPHLMRRLPHLPYLLPAGRSCWWQDGPQKRL
jgi:hypothetical protein